MKMRKVGHYFINKESQVFDRTYFRTILPIPVSETNANPTLSSKSGLLNKNPTPLILQ